MSRNELTRLRVLIDVADGRLSVADATGLLGVGRRQVYRLLDAFRAGGPDGLISRKRGRSSNRALGTVFRETVLAMVRERYADFGPTLAAEKLCELHGLNLGVETLRQWMIGAGLWVRRKDRLKRVHQPRTRRDCLGELVQLDGSEHWWFEGRGPQCTLLVYIDDATSRLMHLKFVETESTFDYFQATREYLEAHGKPVAFYSDKHGVFRVNSAGAVQGDGMVESECGAVAVGRTYLLPPLSSGGALLVRPWLRFHTPLIEPDMQIFRIPLSDKTSRLHPRPAATKLG